MSEAWDWADDIELIVHESGHKERIVAVVRDAGLESFNRARLLAAAPELLEALERLCAQHEAALGLLPQGQACGWGLIEVEAAREAIAKAKGG
jgi:hypothetical protein